MRRSDAPAIERILRDPRATRFLPPRLRGEPGALYVARAMDQQRKGRAAHFSLLAPDDPEPIGEVMLINWSTADRRAEVGILLRRDRWGRGYGAEAVRRLCEFGFGPLKLHRISAQVVAGNERSARMVRSLGFRREGRLREVERSARRWVDLEMYGLLDGELAAVR